jgi:hypothetical protein
VPIDIAGDKLKPRFHTVRKKYATEQQQRHEPRAEHVARFGAPKERGLDRGQGNAASPIRPDLLDGVANRKEPSGEGLGPLGARLAFDVDMFQLEGKRWRDPRP